MFLAIVVFILVLGLLIFVHELGHFVLAKKAGIKVEEFGFGFPPRIFGIRKGETLYSLNLFPLGGFVKIYGEIRKEGKDPLRKRAFYSQSALTRAGILVAGVTMNIVLAGLLLGLGHFIGLPALIDDSQADNLDSVKVQILQVAFDSPAEQAKLKTGDTISELRYEDESISISTVRQVQSFVNLHKGEEITLIAQRGDQVLEKQIVPREDHPEQEGPLGISLARTAIVSYPWYEAIVRGFISAFTLTWAIMVAFSGILWQLMTSGHLAVEIAGPVGIFDLTNQAAQLGFIYVLQFTAILSINLAILNALPIPALDGGRLLFLIIEKIKGSPISQKVERISQLVGFSLLILVMIAITWRDIARMF